MSKPLAALAALLLASAPMAQAALVIDRLDPVGGALSGGPGDTVGWGFTISNDSTTEWLVLTASGFPLAPGWLAYTDLVIAQYILLGPSASLAQVYNPVGPTGAGSVAIDALADLGWTASGTLELMYDTYDGDPDRDGSQIGFSDTATSAVSVTVADSGTVPLPTSAALVALGLLGVGGARARARGAP